MYFSDWSTLNRVARSAKLAMYVEKLDFTSTYTYAGNYCGVRLRFYAGDHPSGG